MNKVVAPEDLQVWAHAFAKQLTGCSAPAMAAIKQLVYQGMELPLAEALRLERAALPDILGSTDYAERLAAFEERRVPRLTGVVQ